MNENSETTQKVENCMRKNPITKFIFAVVMLTITAVLICGCGGSKSEALSDGSYQANLTMEGGTGKAYIQSPVEIKVEGAVAYAKLIWSSSNYDYMIVDGTKYINEAESGGSTFTIPVSNPPKSITV